MNRDILNRLQKQKNYPSVSILMPTHRSFPENQQDKIRFKNLVHHASARLEKELDKKQLNGLVKKLEHLTEEINFSHVQDGLAVFASNDSVHQFMFGFPVKERVIIDESFATRDLVFGYNRTQPYYALILDEKNTRIFHCVRDNLTEASHPDLPLKNFVHDIRSGEIKDTSYNDKIHENEERMKNFLRDADRILLAVKHNEDIPFIISGTEKQLGLFREITRNGSALFGELRGNYGASSASELAKLVWPIAKSGFAEARRKALDELDKAIGAKKFASGISEIYRLAKEGRGLTLLAETKYSYSARVNAEGELIPAEPEEGKDVIDDIVDETIEEVVSKGGKAVFFEDGVLEKYGRIAMILRY